MTAEIAILNKSAVALAADSAVTIQVAGGQKIYNTVNKLFTLSKFQPVGAMVYGGADFMAVPWESIIKEYRRALKQTRYRTLREYADAFVEWLSTAKLLFPEDIEQQIFHGNITGYFQQLKEEVNKRVAKLIHSKEAVDDARIRAVVKELVSEQQQRFLSLPRLPAARQTFEEEFLRRHTAKVNEIRKSVFQELPVTAEDAVSLAQAVGAFYCRDYFGPSTSGLVIAGFGVDDIFPSLIHLAIETLLDGQLKWKEVEVATIDHFTNNATIIPFAQREMVDTFLSGIDPTYKNTVLNALDGILRALTKEIFGAIPDATLPNKSQIITALGERIPELISTFNQNLEAYSRSRHIAPILNAVAALPKDDLAAMAESLVNLTSFKRRISTDAETVGGQIDVAVISKGDGFIWIKRKHYFDAGKNPQFTANYYQDEKS